MGFGERLRCRREELGITQQELAERLGVKKSTIGSYETGKSMPREKVLLDLFDVIAAEPNDLFRDSFSSKADELTPRERELVERYRALSKKGRIAIGAVLDAAQESASKPVLLPERKPSRMIPLFTSPAAAGYASPILGEEYEMIDAEKAPDGAAFAVRISGDSMEPYIHDGSVVYVGRAPLQNGDIGIFCVDGDAFCKQYYRDALGMVYLFSLNRGRSDADVLIPAGSGHTLTCFGRVLLQRRFPLPQN